MEWYIILVLVLAVPFVLLPATFIWYLNIGGMASAVRTSRERQAAARRTERMLRDGRYEEAMNVVDRVEDVVTGIRAAETAVRERGGEAVEPGDLQTLIETLTDTYAIMAKISAVESAMEEMTQGGFVAGTDRERQSEAQPGAART